MVLVDKLLLLLDSLAVHVLQQSLAGLNVGNEAIAAVSGKVFTHDDAQHLEVLGMWCHGVSGYDPAADTQLVGEDELVVITLVRVRDWVQAEGYERQALAALL